MGIKFRTVGNDMNTARPLTASKKGLSPSPNVCFILYIVNQVYLIHVYLKVLVLLNAYNYILC